MLGAVQVAGAAWLAPPGSAHGSRARVFACIFHGDVDPDPRRWSTEITGLLMVQGSLLFAVATAKSMIEY